MATITVNTLRDITGTDDTGAAISGDVVSVPRNFNNAKVPALQLRAAIEAFVDAKVAAKQADLDALRDQKDARIAELVADKVTLNARIDNLQADKANLQSLIDAMGGTVLGRQLRRIQRRQEAQAAADAAAAELARIAEEEANDPGV
jgi:hypothetical protein